jgi:anaerobic magnesium-protoporphyrin IX monomethyl ester cyclase
MQLSRREHFYLKCTAQGARMRFCLINPPRIQPKLWGKPSILQPIDMAYVAAVLEKEHEVMIIDAANEGWNNLEEMDATKYRQGLKNEEIKNRVKQFAPDAVGINIPFCGWWKPAYEVASMVKNIDENIVTVLSGLHPSARAAECLSYPNVDYVVIGEPELTVQALARELEQGEKDLKQVKGIGYVKNKKVVITSPRPVIEDLDSLPFPARHLLPMQTYFEAVKEIPLRGEIRKPWATVVTSRGCPFHCVFCSIHTIMGRKWRGRSPENVVDELEQLVDVYHIKQLDFSDENMTLDRKRMEGICDLIGERGLDLDWFTPNGVRADTLDEKLLTKMKRSGCEKIRIAPESGVQRVVNQVIGKNLDLKAVERAVVLCKKVGIRVGCFFVIGLIGETKEEIRETINFAYKLRRLGAESFVFSIATPVYGTDLYEQAKRGGFLKEDFSDDDFAAAEPLIETPEFSGDELRELCALANMVNPTFTRGKLMKAIRNPRKALKVLFGKK